MTPIFLSLLYKYYQNWLVNSAVITIGLGLWLPVNMYLLAETPSYLAEKQDRKGFMKSIK